MAGHILEFTMKMKAETELSNVLPVWQGYMHGQESSKSHSRKQRSSGPVQVELDVLGQVLH